jgi:hypothetical protein
MKSLRSKKNPAYTPRHASFTASLDVVSPAHSWSNLVPAVVQNRASGATNNMPIACRELFGGRSPARNVNI